VKAHPGRLHDWICDENDEDDGRWQQEDDPGARILPPSMAQVRGTG
jgi:hypothetical protein